MPLQPAKRLLPSMKPSSYGQAVVYSLLTIADHISKAPLEFSETEPYDIFVRLNL